MDYQKIENDFKGMEKKVQSLANKFNKSCDSIKSQELAIAKVKSKLDELSSGNKTPTSIKSLESELKKAEKDVENLENQYQSTIDLINRKQFDLEWAINTGDTSEVSSIKVEQGNLDNQYVILAEQLENARDRAEQLKVALDNAKLNPTDSVEAQQLATQLDLMNSKLQQTKDEANQTKESLQEMLNQENGTGAINAIEKVGNKLDKFKNKISKMITTVAVFNLLRSSLTNLRNSFASLLKTDDNFSASLNQIKANLMTAFAPIYNAVLPAINSLMTALSKLTGTIAKFVAGLFGTSLEDAQEQAKGLTNALEDTKTSGEEASGSLASFDKLEVLQDTSGGSSSGGASDSKVDYSGEIQYSQTLLDFLNNIKDFVAQNKDFILALFTGIVGGLLAIKLGCEGIQALGIGLIIGGIVLLIQDIIKFLNDPSWEGFGNIITDIGIILLGLSTIVGGIPLAIAAAIAIIVGLVISNWNQIMEVLGTIGGWIWDNVIKPVADFFVGLWNGFLGGAESAWEGFKSIFSKLGEFISGVLGKAWEGIKAVFSKGGQIFTGITEGILSGFKAMVNCIIDGINKVVAVPFNGINWALQKIKSVEIVGFKPFDWVSTISVPQLPHLAEGTVIPARHEFAAILGDQKHGVNVEAPLETIKQADREVMEEFMNKINGLKQEEKEIVLKDWTFILQFGNTTFAKLTYQAIRGLEKEIGKPLFVS